MAKKVKSYGEMTFEEQRAAAEGRFNDIGFVIEWPDGTRKEYGKLVKIGPRAIVEDGKLIGFRPEEPEPA